MIRKLTLLILLMTTVLPGLRASELTERADSAYSADDYKAALELYTEALERDGASASLWYNIGNTRYRLGETGKAIVAYERALRLDPTDEDTRTNLNFVLSQTPDCPGDTGSFISNTADDIASLARPDVWAWAALAIFALCIVGVALYCFGSSIMLRKTGFFGAIVLFIATIATASIAIHAANNASASDRGVITASSSILSTSPRTPKDRSEEAMLLHEGTRLQILDSVKAHGDTTGVKWYDVRIDNHHRAWIRSTDVEII